jgi:phosphopentomutase
MSGDSKTAAVVVIDAVGLDTLAYLLDKYPKDVSLPNLARLGLGTLLSPAHAKRLGPAGTAPQAYAIRIDQASASADSVIGHREMVGLVDDRTYSLFPDGFPKDYLKELEKRIDRKTIFNQMAGGMEAIEQNADEHTRTGSPIVYASKCDPLIQLAMDEDVIPVKEQHAIADAAFELARERGIQVTRAIARAYVRTREGEFMRTANRHDAVLPMDSLTLVDLLYERDVWTAAVGKTSELVNVAYHEKIKLTKRSFVDPRLGLEFVHPKGKDTNPLMLQGTLNALTSAKSVYRPKGTFVFANLVDTDSLYGHTRDVEGAWKSLEAVDKAMPLIEERLSHGDLLIVTADHGMAHKEDYGYHNLEPLPLLAERIGYGADLGGLRPGKGKTLADVGWLVAQFFGCQEEFLATTGLKGRF